MGIYVPRHFAAPDRASVARLVHDYPFATLVTPHAAEVLVTHLPLIHVADREPHGTLFGHFARANPHAAVDRSSDSVAIFHGPHAYVTPSWYADPDRAVPTWNYAVVHMHGPLEIARDPAETRAVLDLMVHRFEASRTKPWQLRLEPGFLASMVGAIVGFRIKVKRVDAKWKLSQNRSPDDRRRVAEGLDDEGYAEAAATAAWMRGLTEADAGN